jgi:hypothetical protein
VPWWGWYAGMGRASAIGQRGDVMAPQPACEGNRAATSRRWHRHAVGRGGTAAPLGERAPGVGSEAGVEARYGNRFFLAD